MSNQSEGPLLFKITILGEEGIGKEKFINMFTSNQFLKESDPGLGVTFYKGSLTLDTEKGQQECIIWIWDLKERERYKTLHSRYLKGTNGIMLFFDLTNRPSFNKLPIWIENFLSKNTTQVPILLVGNREESKKFVVSPKEINEIVREFNLFYIETSLTTKEGIFDSFYSITSLTLGIEVDHEYFLSKDIIYYPGAKIPLETPSSLVLSPKDISNLGQKAIFEKIELLDEIYEESRKIKVPLKTLIIEVVLSIAVISLFIVTHLLQISGYSEFILPGFRIEKQDLLAFTFWTSQLMQIAVIIMIIINFIKGRRK
jgi:small GTP-binding protein